MSADTQNFLSNLTFGDQSEGDSESEGPTKKKAKISENEFEEEYDYEDEEDAYDTAELEKFALQKIQK